MGAGLAFAVKEFKFPCEACVNCAWNRRRYEDIARALANGIGGIALGEDKPCLREAEHRHHLERMMRRGD